MVGEIVVDASVAVKWYIPEEDHEPARSLRDDYLEGKHDLIAPALMSFEVINALKYSGHYEGDRLIEASDTLPEYGVDLVPYQDVGPAAGIASKHDIAIYDASYVSLAEKSDTTVYTADSRLINSLEGEHADLVEHIREYSG